MAGLGLGPPDFALFELGDPDERARALEEELQPKLLALGAQCSSGLARVAGKELFVHPGKLPRRRNAAPEEVLVAFSDSPKGYRGLAFLAVVMTREHLHARVGVRGDSPRRTGMQRALEREATNLARKGKPFRKLREFLDWNHEELPELAPAHSTAFWLEMGEALAPGGAGLDLGIAWTQEEARSIALGDLLGVFRDLAPLYKVLANAE
ncbi:conserved hypothetical protein [Anaeromyxobacter dehalogenans 2CP-1]|uniref:Uncharacterized protein n=1 Tax=Anaeromyxobacter dehalogenans (strain ATCC BAA-258 / DSM 21875 / 2CP-1) TaxID=455488 RepID=B8JC41_ANAD2|nr:DUF1054 family protein [Anaeromyxobacter dehalogenans]ACL63963.1 conserved hypothetical protein [Anaeromyxobacter dehalogenans 2CP-1]